MLVGLSALAAGRTKDLAAIPALEEALAALSDVVNEGTDP
jgi:hypothetical protein